MSKLFAPVIVFIVIGGDLEVFLKKKPLIFISVVIVSLFLMSGCLNQKTTPEKMYEVMEKVVLAESTFEDQQEPLVLAEQNEKKLYDRIISLGMKEYDQIVKLSDEALSLVEERRTLMATETESIEKSKVQFEELLPFIEELKDQKMKMDAKILYDVMMERYKLHEEIKQSYSQALQLDKELYQMFKSKDLRMEQLENQINQINKIYTEIYKINEQFNHNTEEYNRLKLEFYQSAGFKIENEK